MKVLHLLDADQYYGAASVVHDLAVTQRFIGIEAEILCIRPLDSAPGPAVDRLEKSGIPTHSWPLGKLAGFGSGSEIVDFARELDVQLLHSHCYKTNILLGLVRKRQRLPAMATLHGYTNARQDPMLYLYYALERLALRRLDSVVAVSDAAGKQFNRNWPGPKQQTVTNGLFVEDAETPDAKAWPGGRAQILSIGRLSEEKNFSLLIHAFSEHLKQYPNDQLLIAGDGPQRANLEALICELELSSQVTLTGYIENTRSLIEQCSVYVNCSRSEGLPVTLLEAMSVGCPIVASDIHANRAILEEGGLAIFFQDNDSCKLSKAMAMAANLGPYERNTLASRQRLTFEAKYTAHAMSRHYAQIYEKLLSDCETNNAYD